MVVEISKFVVQNYKDPKSLAVSATGRYTVIGVQEGEILIYVNDEDQPSKILKIQNSPIMSLSFAPYEFGNVLAIGSSNGTVNIMKKLESEDWVELFNKNKLYGIVTSLNFVKSLNCPPSEFIRSGLNTNHPIGLYLAASYSNGFVVVFSLLNDDNWATFDFFAHIGGVTCVTWDPCIYEDQEANEYVPTPNHILFTTGIDGCIRKWKYNTEEKKYIQKNCYKGHYKQVLMLSFNSNGSSAASLSDDGTIIIWTRDGDELVKDTVLIEAAPYTSSLTWGSNDTTFYCSSSDQEIIEFSCNLYGKYEMIKS